MNIHSYKGCPSYKMSINTYKKELTPPLQCDVHRDTIYVKLEVEMMIDREMVKGSIDLMLLSLIKQRDLYGYEMMTILKRLSDDTYEMSEGTLYAALKRMERKNWVGSYWQTEASGRRKYYFITEDGVKEWERKQENWQWVNELVRKSSEGLT